MSKYDLIKFLSHNYFLISSKTELNMNSRKKFIGLKKFNDGNEQVYTNIPCGRPLLTQILVFAISLHHLRGKRRYSMIQWCINMAKLHTLWHKRSDQTRVKNIEMANKLQALLLLTVVAFVAEARRNVATLFCNDIRAIR